jgi:hypothetical protein
MQTLADYLAADPPDRATLRPAPLVCPCHGVPTVTVMGYVMHMDITPTASFMEDAAENPCCLDVGELLEPNSRFPLSPQRLIFCTACEAGMAARRAERTAAHAAQPSRKAAKRQARLARRRDDR